MICKVLGQFVNTLTANDKYFLLNTDNLTQPIQMLLCKEQKTFSEFSSPFRKYRLNFEHSQTEDHPHSFCISKITDCEIIDTSQVSENFILLILVYLILTIK